MATQVETEHLMAVASDEVCEHLFVQRIAGIKIQELQTGHAPRLHPCLQNLNHFRMFSIATISEQ